MRVVILHNAVEPDAPAAEADVLAQVRAVGEALDQLGHEAVALPCTLNLAEARARLEGMAPDVVFNLVESLGGTDRLHYFAAGLLDALGLPYTGCPTAALFLAGDKLLAKRWMRQAGIPTPDWVTGEEVSPSLTVEEGCGGGPFSPSPLVEEGECGGPYILKAVYEHASFGIDDAAVVRPRSAEELARQLRQREAELGRHCFAERYVEGREFNLALLAGEGGMEVLPPAEIVFVGYPAGKPRVVGRAAKWDEGSFEYRHTERRFDFSPPDRPMIEGLVALARMCAAAFGLRGYARVDFRVDAQNRPWVLEVNANPCLSPDAGFAAALARAGVSFAEAVRRVVRDALARRRTG